MTQPDPHAIYGPPHPPPPPLAPPTQEEARAALAVADRPRIPVRRRHLALYAVSDIGFLVVVFVFIGLIPASWPSAVVALTAGALVIPPLLLKNLVPVVPKLAKRISTAGSLLSILFLFTVSSLDGVARPVQLLIALAPSIVAGVLLVLIGPRQP